MDTLFEIATRVATPLSLAGIVVMAFYLLYRQLIAGPLAVQLSHSHAFQVVNRLVKYVFILALVALIIGVAAYVMVQFVPPAKRLAQLQLVDLSFPETDEYPQLEVKLRNAGDEVAILKQARFTVIDVFQFENAGAPAALPSSWTYDVKFPVQAKVPYSVSVPLSQTVPPNGADRFTFRLGNDASPFGSSMGGGPSCYVFQVRLELLFNEDNRTVRAPEFLVASMPATRVLGLTRIPGDDIYIDKKGNVTTVGAINKATAARLDQVSAVRAPAVDRLLAERQ